MDCFYLTSEDQSLRLMLPYKPICSFALSFIFLCLLCLLSHSQTSSHLLTKFTVLAKTKLNKTFKQAIWLVLQAIHFRKWPCDLCLHHVNYWMYCLEEQIMKISYFKIFFKATSLNHPFLFTHFAYSQFNELFLTHF